MIKGTGITLFKNPEKYIAGEETAVCEVIEGKPAEPRKKPPYITEAGIFGYPTLLNNVETFYYATKVARDEYKNTKFYSISGDIKNPGTYELSEKDNIIDVLEKTKNIPKSTFFVKAGGGACGRVLLEKELKQPLCGLGSLIVYEIKKTNLLSLAKEWIEFFESGNCKKCVPCREGLYRLKESINKGKIDTVLFKDLFFVLENTSFCALGRMAPIPFKDLIEKFHGKI
jgi:NADH:ubiquinone oxidoreductase subunit F (NADH-binding)